MPDPVVAPIAGIVQAALAGCVALLLLVAAAGKLRHRRLLAGVVANYRLLPAAAVAPVAAVLPWLEIAVGLALLAGGAVAAPAAGVASALLLAFAAAMAVNIRRGRRAIDCGCGLGGLRQPLHPALVVRNLALAAALLPQVLAPATATLADRAAAAPAALAGFVLLLLLGALLALPARQLATA